MITLRYGKLQIYSWTYTGLITVSFSTQNWQCLPSREQEGQMTAARAYTKYGGDGSVGVRAGEEGTYTDLITVSVSTQNSCH